MSSGQSAGRVTPAEYEVKAAFLFNFVKFIDWPSACHLNATSPILVGVVGKDPFGDALESVIGQKKVKGRNLTIRRYQDIADIDSCHVLFIAESESSRLDRVFDHLNGRSVLTVSDMDAFTQRGGIIQLYVKANKVRFEINLDSAENINLKISAKLLNLAETVYNRERYSN